MIKNKKGITLVSLVITIAVMLIIASITVTTTYNKFEINNSKKMQNDIELLNDKVSNYYLKYNALPIVRNSENTPITYSASELNFTKDANDNEIYYIIDLSALGDITLNYGQDGFNNPKNSDDVYIINEKSHHIYYIKGVELDKEIYHTINLSTNTFTDVIPPTEPKINIIEGKIVKLGESEYYYNSVKLEFVPGTNSVGTNFETTYKINDGEEISITTLNNNICDVESSGINTITLTTKNIENGETSSKDITLSIIRMGDYVAYDAGTYTHTLDSEKGASINYHYLNDSQTTPVILETEELKWRVIGINNDGQLELISATPTSQILYLYGYDGYNNLEENLKSFCDDLYGKGMYADSARSLDFEYLNSITNYYPTKDENFIFTGESVEGTFEGFYGEEWTYKFPTQEEMDELTGNENSSRFIISSRDGGKTWKAINYFKKFRLAEDSTLLNEENVGITRRVINTYYYYMISQELTTDDGYSSKLVTELVNMINSDKKQWLASRSSMCFYGFVFFCVGYVDDDDMAMFDVICTSYLDSQINQGFYVRPIVTIKSGTSVIMNSNRNSETNMWTLQ